MLVFRSKELKFLIFGFSRNFQDNLLVGHPPGSSTSLQKFEVPQIEHFTDFLKKLSTRKFFTWSIFGTLEVDFREALQRCKTRENIANLLKALNVFSLPKNFLGRNISLCKIVLASFRYVEEFLLRKTF